MVYTGVLLVYMCISTCMYIQVLALRTLCGSEHEAERVPLSGINRAIFSITDVQKQTLTLCAIVLFLYIRSTKAGTSATKVRRQTIDGSGPQLAFEAICDCPHLSQTPCPRVVLIPSPLPEMGFLYRHLSLPSSRVLHQSTIVMHVVPAIAQ